MKLSLTFILVFQLFSVFGQLKKNQRLLPFATRTWDSQICNLGNIKYHCFNTTYLAVVRRSGHVENLYSASFDKNYAEEWAKQVFHYGGFFYGSIENGAYMGSDFNMEVKSSLEKKDTDYLVLSELIEGYGGGRRIYLFPKNEIENIELKNYGDVAFFTKHFSDYPNVDKVIAKSIGNEGIKNHFGALLKLREFYPYSRYKSEIDNLIKIHEDNPSGGIGDLINAGLAIVRQNVQDNRHSYEQNSDGCFEEEEEEEKLVCGTKMKVRHVRCPNSSFVSLFWAVKNESYLSCLKNRFDDNYESGWFKFEGNILSANNGIFLTNNESFEKASRIACGCEKK